MEEPCCGIPDERAHVDVTPLRETIGLLRNCRQRRRSFRSKEAVFLKLQFANRWGEIEMNERAILFCVLKRKGGNGNV